VARCFCAPQHHVRARRPDAAHWPRRATRVYRPLPALSSITRKSRKHGCGTHRLRFPAQLQSGHEAWNDHSSPFGAPLPLRFSDGPSRTRSSPCGRRACTCSRASCARTYPVDAHGPAPNAASVYHTAFSISQLQRSPVASAPNQRRPSLRLSGERGDVARLQLFPHLAQGFSSRVIARLRRRLAASSCSHSLLLFCLPIQGLQGRAPPYGDALRRVEG
jgi:hypothetical protein